MACCSFARQAHIAHNVAWVAETIIRGLVFNKHGALSHVVLFLAALNVSNISGQDPLPSPHTIYIPKNTHPPMYQMENATMGMPGQLHGSLAGGGARRSASRVEAPDVWQARSTKWLESDQINRAIAAAENKAVWEQHGGGRDPQICRLQKNEHYKPLCITQHLPEFCCACRSCAGPPRYIACHRHSVCIHCCPAPWGCKQLYVM